MSFLRQFSLLIIGMVSYWPGANQISYVRWPLSPRIQAVSDPQHWDSIYVSPGLGTELRSVVLAWEVSFLECHMPGLGLLSSSFLPMLVLLGFLDPLLSLALCRLPCSAPAMSPSASDSAEQSC